MSNISMDMIKQLREQTGVGIMECKKALTEANGDINLAIRLLKERGAVTASKKNERKAKEGIISLYTNEDKTQVSCVELQCETDFVAKNKTFENLAYEIAQIVFKMDSPKVEDVLEVVSSNGDKVIDMINALVQKVGEKTVLANVLNLKTDGFFGFYKHFNSKLATIVDFNCKAKTEKAYELANQIAMHVASEKPLSVTRDELDKKIVEEQREIFEKITIDSGKSGDMVQKIVQGKMDAWFSESVLIDQKLFIDGKTTIKSIVDEIAKECGCDKCDIKSIHIIELTTDTNK